MARPVKNNADYFTHDSDMRNDVKIRALRRKHKHVGYAVWCFILEVLTDSDYFEIQWDEINQELLSADFDLSVAELSEIVEYCVKLGLLCIDSDKLFSPTHKKRFNSLLRKRERENGYNHTEKEVIGNENNTKITDENVLCVEKPTKNENKKVINVENDIVKESKVKESKGDIDNSNELYAGQQPDPSPESGEFSEFIAGFNRIRGSRFQAIDKVKRHFNARLKEGFTPAQMLQALETAMKDKYHISEGYKYLTPEFFTRSDKIEKFINVNSSSPTPGQEITHAPQLGADEWMRPDGTRTYGTGSTTVPIDAPPRPSASWWWNDGLKQWNM